MISKFFNSEMHGFSVYADFQQLDASQRSRFAQLWQSCSVNDQCYFKHNQRQQQFLDTLYREMMKAE